MSSLDCGHTSIFRAALHEALISSAVVDLADLKPSIGWTPFCGDGKVIAL